MFPQSPRYGCYEIVYKVQNDKWVNFFSLSLSCGGLLYQFTLAFAQKAAEYKLQTHLHFSFHRSLYCSISFNFRIILCT